MLQVIPHVVGLVALCAEFTCCQCTKLIHFLTCTGIPCRDSHCENGLVRCCLYTLFPFRAPFHLPAPFDELLALDLALGVAGWPLYQQSALRCPFLPHKALTDELHHQLARHMDLTLRLALLLALDPQR